MKNSEHTTRAVVLLTLHLDGVITLDELLASLATLSDEVVDMLPGAPTGRHGGGIRDWVQARRAAHDGVSRKDIADLLREHAQQIVASTAGVAACEEPQALIGLANGIETGRLP